MCGRASPICQRVHLTVATQFGEHGNAQQDRQRVAHPAPLALVGNRPQVIKQAGEVDGHWRLSLRRNGECDRIHLNTSLAAID
jgi:hypothetical protein